MRPDTSSWKSETAYDYFNDLSSDGLAWECLRRNTRYQEAYRQAKSSPRPDEDGDANAKIWGLRSLLPPSLPASEGPVFWDPGATSNNLLVSPIAVPSPSAPISIDRAQFRHDDGGYAAIGSGLSELHLCGFGPQDRDDPLCVVIPLDDDLPARIEALTRLWRLLQNTPAPDQRLTSEKRHRLRQMIRAVDGSTNRASQREIAQAIFGQARVSRELWSASSLRYSTLRLLRDGRRMVDAGYRSLLRSPRGDARSSIAERQTA